MAGLELKEAYEIPANHPLPSILKESCDASNLSSGTFDLDFSCDARLYDRVGGMPIVVFGAGDIRLAHS